LGEDKMVAKDHNVVKPLVSIITPCYNGEEFVHRFLDSVLNQTYSNIEFIFINDGSTDKTEEIVLFYQSRFILRKIDFKYIYQENKGQAAALNKGLKIFKGDYLTWPDSDDILHEDNIKNRVDFFERNKEYNIVVCESKLVDKNRKDIGVLRRIPPQINDNLFDDLIIEKNVYFAGGAYMVRTKTFLECNPKRFIYESRGGQNWQMLLPILHKNNCGYLNEQLYYIFVRQGSHSRQDASLLDKLKTCDIHEDILNNVISELDIEGKNNYLYIIREKYARKRLRLAAHHRNKELLKKYYYILLNNNWVTKRDKVTYLIGKYFILSIVSKIPVIPQKVLREIKKVFL
jgi:glycosyltransferase involved in cell wall biosynthesis